MQHRPADVVVLGSANLDLFSRVPQIPAPGQTVLGDGPEGRPGGKGLNQAVAAARAGAATALLGAVGDDDAAALLLEAATEHGVDTSLVRRVPGPSGTAWITVQPDGENSIVVLGAANQRVTGLEDDERQAVAVARVLVAQLETPLAAVGDAVAHARSHGVRTVLNASPVQDLPPDLLAGVDVLVVNEHESRQLAGADDLDVAARVLLGAVGAVVTTLGAEGALVADGAAPRRVPRVPARVVDTTGAGDTFAGVLAATLASGATLDEAVARAVVAGAVAVEREGAATSAPTAAEVDAREARGSTG